VVYFAKISPSHPTSPDQNEYSGGSCSSKCHCGLFFIILLLNIQDKGNENIKHIDWFAVRNSRSPAVPVDRDNQAAIRKGSERREINFPA
jgi:hypothetical protein